MDKCILLSFYIEEKTKHHGRALHEWLMTTSHDLDLPGCTCFRSVASYGKSGQYHSEAFFSVSGQDILRVDFLVS